ncbi:MAG: hypothetical protein ABIE14_02025 [Patescibacteria group bacterium]
MRRMFNAPHKEALLMMIENRYPKGKIMGSKMLPKKKEEIVDENKENLKEVILYILSVENETVNEIMHNGHKYFMDILSVVEQVMKKELDRVNLNQK